MQKDYDKKFLADAYTSRDYRCAVVLEEYLNELNNPELTKRVNRILTRFNKFFIDLKIVKNKQYYGSMLIKSFVTEINTYDDIPLFVKSLIINIMKTKYKAEIIRTDKK